MNDSGKSRTIKAARILEEFFTSGRKKVVINIEGLSHSEVSRILMGPFLSRMMIMLRYFISAALYPLPFSSLKIWVYRMMGVRIGRNVYIGPAVYIDVTRPDLISIGDNVMIGMGAKIVIHERTMRLLSVGRVRIGEGVTIGGLTLIRGGVDIGDEAEIDALLNIAKSIKKGSTVVNTTGRRSMDEADIL